MLTEKPQVAEPRGREYECGVSGSDCPIVVMKRGNSHGAKGAGHSRHDQLGQLATGGTDWLWRRAAALCEWHEPCEPRGSSTDLWGLGVRLPGATRPGPGTKPGIYPGRLYDRSCS